MRHLTKKIFPVECLACCEKEEKDCGKRASHITVYIKVRIGTKSVNKYNSLDSLYKFGENYINLLYIKSHNKNDFLRYKEITLNVDVKFTYD